MTGAKLGACQAFGSARRRAPGIGHSPPGSRGGSSMTIGALGYVGIRSGRLDDWATYGPRFLGLELVEQSAGMLKFRMDDRKQRIIVSDGEDAAHAFGWEVEDGAGLRAVARAV